MQPVISGRQLKVLPGSIHYPTSEPCLVLRKTGDVVVKVDAADQRLLDRASACPIACSAIHRHDLGLAVSPATPPVCWK
jgi:hypothetical protein